MKKKRSFTLRLSEEQLSSLREIATTEKRTVSAVIRNLIDGIKTNKVRSASQKDGLQ